jgi:hypothetical protein
VLYQTEGNRVTGNLKSKTLRRCVYGSGPYVQRAGATDNNEIPPVAYDRIGEGIRAPWPNGIVHGQGRCLAR